MSNLLTIIPAAGRGTRLGLADRPKILAPLDEHNSIWSVLYEHLAPVSDRVAVIMSPWGEQVFRNAIPAHIAPPVEVVLQHEPLGMGHAVFCAAPFISSADVVMVVWGDQVNVSRKTLEGAIAQHASREKTVVVPVVAMQSPYVEYRFDQIGKLERILESREGDVCNPGGLGDVGTFILSSKGLTEAWNSFVALDRRGSTTGELNFLPFLIFLAQHDWKVEPHIIDDSGEARGVNTKEDLAFAIERIKLAKAR